jgi:hypothetical protein
VHENIKISEIGNASAIHSDLPFIFIDFPSSRSYGIIVSYTECRWGVTSFPVFFRFCQYQIIRTLNHPGSSCVKNSLEARIKQKKPLSSGGLFEDKKAAGS